MLDSLYEGGVNFILFLQSLGSWLETPMRFFTFLGQEEFFLLVMPALYWSFSARLGIRIGIILLLSNGLNSILKVAFHSPRPYWYSPAVRPLAEEASFGMPSGHAQNAAAIWGMLAASTPKLWLKVISISLIFLIGFSRMFLGVHFLWDVLVGWLVGLLLLGLFLRFERPFLRWFAAFKLSQQIGLAFGVSALLILLAWVAQSSLAGWEIPTAWVSNAATAFPESDALAPAAFSSIFTSAGALFGMAAGVIWIFARGGYSAEGSLVQRILRFLLGAAVVFVLWFGLGAIFPRGEYVLAYVLRYLRYFLIGLWISALAPLVFMRLGLAQQPLKKKTPAANGRGGKKRHR